jgi:hypothetical protein
MIDFHCKFPEKDCQFLKKEGGTCNYCNLCEYQATSYELKWFKEQQSKVVVLK